MSCPCRAKPEREATSYEQLENTSLVVPGYQRYIRTHTSVRSVVYTLCCSRTCVVYIVVRVRALPV